MNNLTRLSMLRGRDAETSDRYGETHGEIENRFRDKRGRDHYDNGRYAPMRSEYGGTYMGYSEPTRMNYDGEVNGRRSWEIIENNAGSDRNYTQGGMRQVMGFTGGMEVDHSPMHEMNHRGGETKPGHATSKTTPRLTRDIAEDWMENIMNEDGTRGAHWSLEEVKKLMQSRGVQCDPVRLWVAMNADYSDNVLVNKKYGIDKPEFYMDAAIARWLNDKDAVSDKQAAYYTYVVKH